MNATHSSELRKGIKTLSLREKIFELHDAVKTLQTKQTKIEKSALPKSSDTSTRLDTLESNTSVLKQAIGTFADAVSDEIEELQRGLLEKIDSKVARLEHRIEEL